MSSCQAWGGRDGKRAQEGEGKGAQRADGEQGCDPQSTEGSRSSGQLQCPGMGWARQRKGSATTRRVWKATQKGTDRGQAGRKPSDGKASHWRGGFRHILPTVNGLKLGSQGQKP